MVTKEELNRSKTPLKWIFAMAWRDGRASVNRLSLFMGSIILGITAVVAIQSFSENLQKNIALQSKALMGADYLIDSRQLPNACSALLNRCSFNGVLGSCTAANACMVT